MGADGYAGAVRGGDRAAGEDRIRHLATVGTAWLCDPRRMHANVERVLAAASALGLVVDTRTFPDGTRTAEEAARAVGCEAGQIVKSLVFMVDGAPVMALVSGANRLDEARLVDALGGDVVTRADADAVRAATSFPIGGVPPFGHPDPLPTAVDEDLLAYDEVWAAAGTPRDVFPIDPAELVRVTGGRVAPLKA
jgi:prolyl-tRNA editing enzyme YbaK/EbsC (Cys-tRNA(Pro) deacylase)